MLTEPVSTRLNNNLLLLIPSLSYCRIVTFFYSIVREQNSRLNTSYPSLLLLALNSSYDDAQPDVSKPTLHPQNSIPRFSFVIFISCFVYIKFDTTQEGHPSNCTNGTLCMVCCLVCSLMYCRGIALFARRRRWKEEKSQTLTFPFFFSFLFLFPISLLFPLQPILNRIQLVILRRPPFPHRLFAWLRRNVALVAKHLFARNYGFPL